MTTPTRWYVVPEEDGPNPVYDVYDNNGDPVVISVRSFYHAQLIASAPLMLFVLSHLFPEIFEKIPETH